MKGRLPCSQKAACLESASAELHREPNPKEKWPFALIWSRADVIGLFSNNVVSFLTQCGFGRALILNQFGSETADVVGSSRLCSQFL
jgi:hypothetical protein